jgi:hypothetical protein
MTNQAVPNGVLVQTATGTPVEDANFTFDPTTQTLAVPKITTTGAVTQTGNETFAAGKSIALGAAATGQQIMTDLLETLTSANGAAVVNGWNEELITLSTVGLTTDSVANLLPANSIILAVTSRVVTTITTTTNWAVGDGTTSGRFSAANSTLTAGTTQVGLAHQAGNVTTTAAGATQAAAAKVRITCTVANPGAGAVRVTVFYQTYSAATA